MELNVTALASADLIEFSASRAERGQNVGPETWANANDEASERPLLTTPEQLDQARDYFKGFGAWDDAEIAAWTPTEVNALTVQFISGDLREAQDLCPGDGPGDIDWDAHQALAEHGTISGCLFASGPAVFFYLGS